MLDQRIDLSVHDFQASFDLYLGNDAQGGDGAASRFKNYRWAKTIAPMVPTTARSAKTASALRSTPGKTPRSDTVDHTDFFKTGSFSNQPYQAHRLPIGINGNVEDWPLAQCAGQLECEMDHID